MNGIIYTAIFGGYDPLKGQPLNGVGEGGRFLAYMNEHQDTAPPPWEIVPTQRTLSSPRLDARRHKLLPHVVLPPCDYSLWIDGSTRLKPGVSLEWLVDQYLREADIAFFAHPRRRCLYEEAFDSMRQGLDDRTRIFDQISRYTREGFPQNAGLVESTILLRRHTPAVQALNEAWWQEVSTGSVRDQLSLPYVLRTTGINYHLIPGDITESPLLSISRHAIPRCRPRRPARLRAERLFQRVVAALHQRAPATFEAAQRLGDQIAPSLTTWLRRLDAEDW